MLMAHTFVLPQNAYDIGVTMAQGITLPFCLRAVHHLC